MAEDSWPFDNQLIDENAWETYFSNIVEDCVFGNPGAPTGQVYADGSGMIVKRRAGSGWVHGWYWRDLSEKTLSVPVNSSTSPRTDRVVERRDLVNNRTTTELLVGTPTSSATPPSLTQNAGGIWETPLARIRVDAGAGTAGNAVQTITAAKVTDERIFQPLRTWRTTALSQLPTAGVPLWQPAVDVAGNAYRWNGSAWAQTASSIDVGPTPWLGVLRHGAVTYPIDPYSDPSQSGGIYKVENGWVSGSCTIFTGTIVEPPGSLRPEVPLPVNRKVHPVNSQIGNWTFANGLGEWSEGSLIIGPASIVSFTTWRGLHGENAAYLNLPLPGFGSGGSLLTTVSMTDYYTWNFSYYAGA